jgi:L-aspartate oxidase
MPSLRRPSASVEPAALVSARDSGDTASLVTEIRRIAWDKVGLVRDAVGLRDALARLAAIEVMLPRGASEARSLATVARLVATAALARPESRGAHFRSDHPLADRRWRRRILLTPVAGGEARVSTFAVGTAGARAAEVSA